jgi:hypothetical protein
MRLGMLACRGSECNDVAQVLLLEVCDLAVDALDGHLEDEDQRQRAGKKCLKGRTLVLGGIVVVRQRCKGRWCELFTAADQMDQRRRET